MELKLNLKGWALVALLTGATGIGFSPIFVRLSEVGPFATAYYRLFFAFPFLALGIFKTPLDPSRSPLVLWPPPWILATSGFFFAGDLAVWHWSIQLTSVANATLLANFAPIFVVLGGWLLWGKRVTRSFMIATVIVLSGAMLLLGSSLTLDVQHIWGDALGVLTAVFYAGYLLSVAHLRLQFSTLTISLGTSGVGALLLLGITLGAGETLWPLTTQGWFVLIGLAVLSQVIGQTLITYALAHLPTAFSSVSLLIQPLVATLVAWGLFKETLSPMQAMGGGVILLGIILARHSSQPLAPTPVPSQD